MPRSKKKKPGDGRRKQFEEIFCVSELVLIFLLLILDSFFQATAGELIVFYLVGKLAVIITLRAIDRRAAEYAMEKVS